MKTIGLIGGMSWESSLEYYRLVNERVKKRCGALHSAKCILYSVDFEEIANCQRRGRWREAAQVLIRAAQSLEKAGADLVLICTNTMHKVASEVDESVRIPLIHIADPTADRIRTEGLHTVGLLGTKFTMEEYFYKTRLEERGVKVLIPGASDREIIHRVIYGELCAGKLLPSSREEYKRIIRALVDRGAQGVVLGCTEIGLLVKQEDASVPLFDTTVIHAEGAVAFALEEEPERQVG